MFVLLMFILTLTYLVELDPESCFPASLSKVRQNHSRDFCSPQAGRKLREKAIKF
jgi:hypothetical protein